MWLGLCVNLLIFLTNFSQIWSFLTDFHEAPSIKINGNSYATLNRLTHDEANGCFFFFCIFANESKKESHVRTSSSLIFRSIQLIILTYRMRRTCKVGVMLVPLQSSEVMCGSIFWKNVELSLS